MSQQINVRVAVFGINIGKSSLVRTVAERLFCGKSGRAAKFGPVRQCVTVSDSMEACVGAHHDFRDAEAIAETVQRPTMKFVAMKTADQLDLQALHRVRERLVEGGPRRPNWDDQNRRNERRERNRFFRSQAIEAT